jgi:alkylation response protein AidB-like acyl-CoA dehydrogenase
MDVDLTPDQRLLLDTTREFLEREGSIPYVRGLQDRGLGFETGWWQRGAELGWTAMLVPEQFGGGSVSGRGLHDAALIAEAMGRLVSPGPMITANVIAAALSEAENAEQFADLIEAIVAGEAIPTWAGRFLTTLRSTDSGVQANLRSGKWHLTGHLNTVENADQATILFVLADGPDGWQQFVVPTDTAGVVIHALDSLDFTRHFCSVDLGAVELGPQHLVRYANGTSHAVERQLQVAVALQCAETVGTMDRVLEFTIRWMFDRYSFGRPLASYQALKHRMADNKLYYEASQAATWAAVHAVQERRPDAGELVSVAKSYVGQHATDLIQDCVQLHGGLGVTWEHDLHLYLRRATVNRNMWGTPAQHLARIADLLGV